MSRLADYMQTAYEINTGRLIATFMAPNSFVKV